MSALPIIITSAGLAALVNAANTGTEAVIITQVGISATTFAPTEATTAIPGEIKRLASIAGVVVADDTLHIAVSDTSADAYTLRTFGLYLDTGVLLAVYSSAASIAEKAAPATLLLNADIKLTSPLAGAIEFGDSSFANPPASEAVVGVLRLATEPEALAGINGTRAIVPTTLKATILSYLNAYSATVTAALALKSNQGHYHHALDVNEGVFVVARLPDLAMAKITGLVAALATKASAVHTHAMADITGLAVALALKLDAAAFTWANLANKPDLVINGQSSITARGAAGNGNALIAGGNADLTGIIGFYLGDGTRVGWIGQAHKVARRISFTTENGGSFGFDQRPDFAGATPWDSANFNPANYAAAIHSHDWAQITGKPNLAINYADVLFNSIQCVQASNPIVGRIYLGNQGNGSRWLIYDGAQYQLPDAQLLINGSAAWHAGNFNPADKAAAIHSHDWAQITGKPDFTASSAAQFRANSTSQPLSPTAVWAAAQLVAAVQAATIAVDMSAALNFTTVMTGNRTLGAPSNAKPGQSGVIEFLQDATGGRTLAFNAAWKFEGASPPTLSTAANARDVLVFTVLASNVVVASLMKGVG
ncbi:MAG: hypothetical protein DCF29_09610 [Alphaproteobacteria bacterium]|nr:MAG: hypothetical protein DCF29_09610 [Alphaproteobacteria bacterium]